MWRAVKTGIVGILFSVSAEAHLMPAQRATLNVVDGSVFAVIALPISAFSDLDDNDDKQITMEEFNRHRANVSAAIQRGVALEYGDRRQELLDIVLSPEATHGGEAAHLDQLTVMGRFALPQPTPRMFTLRIDLYGTEQSQQQMMVTARRRVDGWRTVVTLTPRAPSATLPLGAL